MNDQDKLDSVNNPSIKLLKACRSALRKKLNEEIKSLAKARDERYGAVNISPPPACDENNSISTCRWFLELIQNLTPE